MAGAIQHQSCGSALKSSSASSNDSILADTPVDGADQVQQYPHHASLQHDVGEIASLGAKVVEALKIVNKLEKLGLDRHKISLPKCVILGQQSTGKSSVIEAILGIKTPRDSGICTRCPLFIELQPSADPNVIWHAEIHLLRQYDVLTDLRHRGMDTEFPGWIPAVAPGRTPFAHTDIPVHLEYLIRCAQRATLSPLENPESFLDPAFDDRNIHKTLFSPNIVCIVISKSALQPLSFYDLPGIIGQAETEEEEYALPLVKSLATKYIQDPEALILVTCALENDIANSIAAGLARELKVTERCIGVLTKPDRLPQGSSSSDLVNIFEGRRFQLGHEYFVVKNLNMDEISEGLTQDDARRLEQDFFSSVAPWSTDLQSYQSRFGTVNMQRYISSQLGNRVKSKLPVIHRQIEEYLAIVEAELSNIPDIPLHAAVRTVADVVHAFAQEMRSEMAGHHGFMGWSDLWDEIQQAFRDGLLKMRPTMSTIGELDRGLFFATLAGRSVDESIVIESDDDDETSNIPETPSKKRKHDVQATRETETPTSVLSLSHTPNRLASRTSRQMFSNVSKDVTNLKKPFKLDDVARHISQTSKSRVSGQINPKVREDMKLSALKYRPAIVDSFFNNLETRLKQYIQILFDKHFDAWTGCELYSTSLTVINKLIDNNIHEQRVTMAAENLNDERENHHVFRRNTFKKDKAVVMETYTQARFNARFNSFIAEAEAHYKRALSQTEKEKVRKDGKKIALIKEEPYAHEIDLVADIATYYNIASRRIHDSITMRIESKLFNQLCDKLCDQLQDELGIYDEQNGSYNAQRLLAESPERLTRRNNLLAKKKTLTEGLQYFTEHLQ